MLIIMLVNSLYIVLVRAIGLWLVRYYGLPLYIPIMSHYRIDNGQTSIFFPLTFGLEEVHCIGYLIESSIVIILFKSITMLCGSDSIMHNILHI